MSSLIPSGGASGTGSVTLLAPNTNSTQTLTLPDQTATIATLTTPSFTSTIGVGGATPASSGAGITFPASQSQSSNANTLDDYEEGTWTPVLVPGGGSITTQTGSGQYQKIGNMVYLTGLIVVSNVGTASGGGSVSGLPFTNSAAFSGCGSESQINGKALNIRQYSASSSTYVMNYYDNSGLCNGISNNTTFMFNVYYQTSQ